MPNTSPHQRVVHIHRERASSDFLGIKNENWKAASRTLGAHALRLYMYLAANANNFELALSPAAIEAEIGIPRSTYKDQFRKLINYGYLVPRSGNRYDFYETPQDATRINQTNTADGYDFENYTAIVQEQTDVALEKPSEDIEINNINNINNTINSTNEKQVSHSLLVEKYVF
ncbi:MAG: hypothetical protein IJ301_04075 [Clostridia bacterium]|nr:hypothetical protein [Clostridia bacterium]